jgi:circadian clock protein KaiB
MDDKPLLRLFIAADTPLARRAIENIEGICHNTLGDTYELQIVNIFENPELTEDAFILATPTLVKVRPKPERRVIGDLSDAEKVLFNLDLYPADQGLQAKESPA